MGPGSSWQLFVPARLIDLPLLEGQLCCCSSLQSLLLNSLTKKVIAKLGGGYDITEELSV